MFCTVSLAYFKYHYAGFIVFSVVFLHVIYLLFFNRSDDFNDPFHLERISTLNTIEAVDLGAVPNNSMSRNYTHPHYKINEYYNAWLPDLTKRQDSKTTYSVQITFANGTNETFVWHGPPGKINNFVYFKNCC